MRLVRPAPLEVAGRLLGGAREKVTELVEPLGWFHRERFPALPSDAEAARAFARARLAFAECREPEVSIIVPVYGKFATTWSCLESLATTDAGCTFEVIVVNDCSPDRTAEMLEHVHGVEVLTNQHNLGYLRSNNRAAKLARGRWLCLLNNDTRLTTGWLRELLDTFANFPNAGLVGAKLLFPDGRLQEAGGIVFNDGSCANYGRWRDPERPEYSFARRVDYCSAACALLPKSLWEELGGFDDHFAPAYYEDTDLAFRVRRAGRDVMYQPLARVVHYHGITHGRDAKRGLKRSLLSNRARFAERWREALKSHPNPGTRSRHAAEWQAGPGYLVVVDRLPTLADRAAWANLSNALAEAQRAGHRVSVWVQSIQNSPRVGRLALQRQGIEVIHPPYGPSRTEFLRSTQICFGAVRCSSP